MKIIPLSEGSFTIDKTKLFIPFNVEIDNIQQRSIGSLLVEIQPFVIITSKDILLLDTGLGFTNEDNILQIHQNLLNAGIQPSSVTKVLLSHLHKDHAGGVRKGAKLSNENFLSFPGAKYYLQGKELNFAFEKGFPSYITENLEILKNAPQVIRLPDDSGKIDDYIFYEVTKAHSPYHQVFWIREGVEIIFFGGDDASQLQQMKNRFVAKYDFNGKKAMQLRQEWWAKGREEGWTFLFYHDLKTPFIHQLS